MFVASSSISRYWICTGERGFASRLPRSEVRTKIPMNLVVIMKDVGREVWRFSQPVIFCWFWARFTRMVLSMRPQIIRANTRISPRASMRRGDLRNRALTITGSLRNPKFCSTDC